MRKSILKRGIVGLIVTMMGLSMLPGTVWAVASSTTAGCLQTGDGRGNCAGQVMRVLTGDEKITADEYFISFDYLYPSWADMYNYYTWYSFDKDGISGKKQFLKPAILQTDATLKLYCDGINAPVVLTDTLKPDAWHNFTFHFKGNLLSVYMDGEPVKLKNNEYWICGTAINAYGNYPYKINNDRLDWKLRCPNCGLPFSAEESLEFPTNDFKAYYLGGLNEYGEFDRELAKKHNDELIAAGEAGNLVNRYVECGLSDEQRNKLIQAGVSDETMERICTDPEWGVDDGWGYIDSATGEKYTCVAYYNHWYSWQDGPVKRGLNSLKDAYLYTGEQKYADAAIIILDRMADVYPDMDVSAYRAQDGFLNGVDGLGKVENSVWECGNVNTFMLAFDAVYPAISTMSETALNFLNEKSVCQDKSNPGRIKLNFEDNVLRQVVPAFHKAQIHGNEGMHQQSIVLAAVILDSYPETQDWIYKAFATGGKYEAGNFYKLLINRVDHDGQAYESPFYNAGWLSNWLGVAEALDGYELPEGIPLKDGLISDPYKNVKFKKMFYGIYPLLLNQMYVANIGDTVQAGAPDISIIQKDELIKAFSKYGDIELAQIIYMLNGNSTVGIKEDIFVDDPGAIAEEIQAIIEENGPLDMKSKLMSGTGFAVLRDGEAGEAAAGSYRYPFLEMEIAEATAPVSTDYPPTLQFNASKKGDVLTTEFRFDGDVSKKYNMTIEKWTTGWWGTYDVYLNDRKLSPMSFQGTGAVNETIENISLQSGTNKLRFVCTSESDFKMGVRFLTVSEIKEEDQAEKQENTQRELWMTPLESMAMVFMPIRMFILSLLCLAGMIL